MPARPGQADGTAASAASRSAWMSIVVMPSMACMAAFARTGNPNHKLLPKWEPFDTTKRAIMVLDNECKLVNDPHGAEQKVLHSVQNG